MSTSLIEQHDLGTTVRDESSLPEQLVRVLHVINGEHYSGAERVQDLLGQRLPEFGFKAGYACLKPGRFASMRQALDADLFDTPMRSRFDFRPLAELVRIVRKNRYQIIHTHTARSALLGRLAAAICRVPHVHHLHSPTALDTTRWLTNRVNMGIESVSLRKADGVIAVSHSLGQYAIRHRLGGGVLKVVHNGVPAQGPLSVRDRPDSVWTIGSVALFRPRKGLEVLLESLAQLRRQGLPVRLRAVGAFETTDYEVQVKSLADRLNLTNAIDWTGFTRDVSAELRRMDLFVLPSLFGEGLPMVILEAMAAGVPVVATRVEGAPEAIRDTVDGLLAEPGNSVDLANRIADVVTGRLDWKLLREHAHRRQQHEFSDRSMARGVAEVYRQVLERRQVNSAAAGVNRVSEAVPEREIVVMGTRIDNLTLTEAVADIKSRLDDDQPTQVAFVNADCINITYRNSAYRQVLADADRVFADGIGMKIAGQVLRQPVCDNVNGTDLFPKLCMALTGAGKRVYLLGGKPGVADQVGRWITTHFPGVIVSGARDGYFRPHEEPAVIDEIHRSGAELLLVALGAPRQDAWIHDHLADTGCRVAIGVGGLFDFYSGRIPRAPLWMRRYGLEWLYRLSREPVRLAKRYLVGNPLFLARIVCEKFRPRDVVKRRRLCEKIGLAREVELAF